MGITKWETESLKTMSSHLSKTRNCEKTWFIVEDMPFGFRISHFVGNYLGLYSSTLTSLKRYKIYINITDLNVFCVLSGRTMSGQKGFILVLKEQHRGLLLISVVKPFQLSPPSNRCQKTPVVSLVHTRKTRQHFPQPPSLFQTSEKRCQQLSGTNFPQGNVLWQTCSSTTSVLWQMSELSQISLCCLLGSPACFYELICTSKQTSIKLI